MSVDENDCVCLLNNPTKISINSFNNSLSRSVNILNAICNHSQQAQQCAFLIWFFFLFPRLLLFQQINPINLINIYTNSLKRERKISGCRLPENLLVHVIKAIDNVYIPKILRFQFVFALYSTYLWFFILFFFVIRFIN